MADIKKILDAMAALCNAHPDVVGLGVDIIGHGGQSWPHFTIKCRTEEAVYAFAEGRDVKRHYSDEGTNTWLACYGSTTIYGPHVPCEKPKPVDESKVDAALAQAEAAVQS